MDILQTLREGIVTLGNQQEDLGMYLEELKFLQHRDKSSAVNSRKSH